MSLKQSTGMNNIGWELERGRIMEQIWSTIEMPLLVYWARQITNHPNKMFMKSQLKRRQKRHDNNMEHDQSERKYREQKQMNNRPFDGDRRRVSFHYQTFKIGYRLHVSADGIVTISCLWRLLGLSHPNTQPLVQYNVFGN